MQRKQRLGLRLACALAVFSLTFMPKSVMGHDIVLMTIAIVFLSFGLTLMGQRQREIKGGDEWASEARGRDPGHDPADGRPGGRA